MKKQLDIRYLPVISDNPVFQPEIIVVVDILRATSTIPVMLSKNVKRIIPVIEIQEAEGLKLKLAIPVCYAVNGTVKKSPDSNTGIHLLNFSTPRLRVKPL